MVKNGVFKAAVTDSNLSSSEMLGNLLQGHSYVLFSSNVSQEATKKLASLVQKNSNLLLVGAHVDGTLLSAETFENFKNLPEKEVLFQHVLDLILNPSRQFTRVLNQSQSAL